MVDKPKQIATMVLRVDLQCGRCYKKVKKLLCKYPQIQDQVYDEKQNTVTVKVVCCCPEKIMRKIICKGGESIKSFEVKFSEKKSSSNTETPEKIKPDKKPSSNGKPGDSSQVPNEAEPDKKKVPGHQQPTCCRECYEGRGGGPCVYGYSGLPPCYQYDAYWGRLIYDSYGGRRGSCYLICEEDSWQSCRIM